MTTLSMLKNVKRLFPELKQLPKAKLQVVEEALVYAAGLGPDEGLISEEENKQLLKKLGLKGGINPANSLKAYRLRQILTQQELARRANIPQSNISAMEKGTRPIGLKSAKKLALILHCNYKKLV